MGKVGIKIKNKGITKKEHDSNMKKRKKIRGERGGKKNNIYEW